MKQRANGEGGIIKTQGSKNWYILYRVNGRQIRETSGSSDKEVAEALLRRRLEKPFCPEVVPVISKMTPTESYFYEKTVKEGRYHIIDLTKARGCMPDFLLREKHSGRAPFFVEVKWKGHDAVTKEQKAKHRDLFVLGLRTEIVFVSDEDISEASRESLCLSI